MAFFGGSTGVIYRQFSVTIVSAMALSVLVALILTPALCATLLQAARAQGHEHRRAGFFGWFNRSFDRANRGYCQRSWRSMLAPHAAATWSCIWPSCWRWACCSCACPRSFLPDEDQGVLFARCRRRRARRSELHAKAL